MATGAALRLARHPVAAFARLTAPTRRLWAQTSRLRAARVVLVVAVLGAIALVLVETPLAAAHGIVVPVAFVLALVHAAALPGAVRLPSVAAPVALAAALLLQALSADDAEAWPWWPVLIVTQGLVLTAVATRTVLPVALLHWVLAVAASASLAAWLRPDDAATAGNVVVFGAISAGGIVVGLLTAQWQRIRSQLLTERRIAVEESERRLLMEERSRIARELHDVVAHSLSLITVQSSTARFRHAAFSEEAAEEFDRIGAQSRQALDEMRGLLRVLRGTEEGTERRPQPGLLDVPELVAHASGAGTPITFEEPTGAWASDVAALTGLAAYRVVQEGTSNALRHAPGSTVHVALARVDDVIEVAVVNGPAAEAPPASTSGGHGVTGMVERVESVGGSVRIGPTGDGGFAVRATLPVHPGAAS